MNHTHETGMESGPDDTVRRVTRGRRFAAPFLARALSLGAACGAFCGLESSAYAGPSSASDVDLDGLSDGLEAYLNVVSSNPAWDVSPLNGDSDGDSQPDGFEFCLSGRAGAVSPSVVHPVEPRMTLASYQQNQDIVVSLFVIPGALSVIDDFHLYIAVKESTGAIQLVDLTPKLAFALSDVDFAWWGPYQMAILDFRIPADFVRLHGAVGIAAVGRLDGLPLGDTLSLAASGNKIFRWVYTKPKGGGNTNASAANGTAEPQDGSIADEWESEEVCGSVDTQSPTSTPGVLESVVVSIGCTEGAFACNAGICSMSGSASAPKLILDVDWLLGL